MKAAIKTLRTGIRVMQETKNGVTTITPLTNPIYSYSLKPLTEIFLN
jgi:hypothetical protein